MNWTKEQVDAMNQRRKAKEVKPSKFKNVKTIVDGIKFDSKLEAARWGKLKLLEKSGYIQNLQRQVEFKLAVNNYLICKYIADFVYYKGEEMFVEDCKSAATQKLPVYRLKKKLMLAILNIVIID